MTDAEVYAANGQQRGVHQCDRYQRHQLFGQEVQTASSGSGFVLTSDGYIVTNYPWSRTPIPSRLPCTTAIPTTPSTSAVMRITNRRHQGGGHRPPARYPWATGDT
jgi:hypothetical protein